MKLPMDGYKRLLYIRCLFDQIPRNVDIDLTGQKHVSFHELLLLSQVAAVLRFLMSKYFHLLCLSQFAILSSLTVCLCKYLSASELYYCSSILGKKERAIQR